jgi:hypothetical protein
MTSVTITLDEAVVEKARDDAAKQGKSLSHFLSEILSHTIGRKTSDSELVDAFLSGPSLSLTINGRAPSTDELYD